MPEAAKAMTIRLPAGQVDELDTVAAVDGQHVSEVIRTAISAYIAQRKHDESFQQGLRARIERARRMLDATLGGSHALAQDARRPAP